MQKNISNVCIVDSVYTLFLYSLIIDDDQLEKTYYFVSSGIAESIIIIRKSKFPQNPKRSVRFSGKRTKRSVQKRKARNTQKAETKVL